MTNHHLHLRPLLAFGLLVAACGEQPGTVTLDFSALAARADQLVLPLDQLRIVARPDTLIPSDEGVEEATVSLEDLTFELDVPAGRWLLEVTREWAEAEPAVATYFGELQLEVASLELVEVVVPMFPAGEVAVTVTAAENPSFELPDATLVRVVPQRELLREGEPAEYAVPFPEPGVEYVRALPTGEYVIRIELTYDGETFVPLSEDLMLTVEHGVRTEQFFHIP